MVWEPDDAFVAPIAWPVETQRSFAHYFALIVRMTHTFPQTAAFTDVAGRVRLDAEVYRGQRSRVGLHVCGSGFARSHRFMTVRWTPS